MSTSREVNDLRSETMAGINFRSSVVTEKEILQMLTFLECVVMSPSLYMLINLFPSVSVNSGFQKIHLFMPSEYSTTIHLDFRK